MTTETWNKKIITDKVPWEPIDSRDAIASKDKFKIYEFWGYVSICRMLEAGLYDGSK